MYLVTFPNNPYVGQIFYHPESERTYEFCETTRTDKLTGKVHESATWFDITEKDLVPCLFVKQNVSNAIPKGRFFLFKLFF